MASQFQLQCPACGAQTGVTVNHTITDDSPELKALLDGTLGVAQCPGCGQKLNVPTQFIYRDSTNPCIYVLAAERPPEDQQDAFALRVDECATAMAQQNGMERPQVRLLFSRPEFIEKIFLHRAGLDDRVIEYAKYQLLTGGAEYSLDLHLHRLLYDFGHSTEQQLVFIIFLRKTKRPLRLLHVPMEEYRQLAQEIANNPQLRTELDHLFPGCMVDVDLIFDKLRAQSRQQP